jgi:hypothetical protein
VRNTADENSDEDHFISTSLDIRQPTSRNGNDIGQEQEQQAKGDRELLSLSQSASSFLGASGRCTCSIAAFRERILDAKSAIQQVKC